MLGLPVKLLIVICLVIPIRGYYKDKVWGFDRPYHNPYNDFYSKEKDTLELVHVLFRHGERTVDPTTLYPNDPYINETYYPYGVGQLTTEGKRTEYRLGQTLRKRYDSFLGKIYTPDILDARTTDVNRTKMSLQLVLAGLFPPIGDQIFEPGLNWQPISYNYEPRNKDKELLGIFCPNFKKMHKEYIETPKIKKDLSNNDQLFQYLSQKSGWNIKHYGDIFYLYWGLRSEKEWGFELPSWTDIVYPKPLQDLTIKEYFITTGTPQLRQLSAGYLLKKMLKDTIAKIDGTLIPPTRKMFLYSAHESNIANFLASLEVFKPHIPPYGCSILVEVHKIMNVYGFKFYYQDQLGSKPKLLIIPGCQEFCPIDAFLTIVSPIIPPTDDLCELQ